MAAFGWVILALVADALSAYRYQLVRQKLHFGAAEHFCRGLGGHLASVHNSAENNKIYNLCHAAGQDCWIGFHLQGSKFVWTDGSSTSYNHFHPGEPDNYHGEEGCALMVIGNDYHGLWSDKACEAGYASFSSVCKLPSSSVSHTTHPTQPAPVVSSHGSRLSIQGTHFVFGGKRVFLSGINKAWEHYAYDFGNGQYSGVKSKYEHVFQQLQNAGGNSIRIWIHIEGETSPHFDTSGHVTGLDRTGTFLNDMKDMLTAAQRHNIFVFPTLWNGAVNQNTHYRLDGLIKDTGKLQSYIDRALKPMVNSLKNYPALGGWDLMNEPEGELKPDQYNSDPCFDTRALHGSGAGWAGKLYTAQEFLRFFNWQADAIKQVDPQALVTVGAWSGRVNTDHFGFHNMYRDSCLVKAGGKTKGILDFYQVHSYDWQGRFGTDSPFEHNFAAFGLDKPLVIGEFREKSGGGLSINQLYDYAYQHGYAGGWGWSETDGNMNNLLKGISHIRSYHDSTRGTVNVRLH